MRIRTRRKVDSITSDDSSASLSYIRTYNTHTDGGDLYRFEIESDLSETGKFIGTVLIEEATSFIAYEKAKEEGRDIDNWSSMQRLENIFAYKEKFGAVSYLNELKLDEGKLTPENIKMIRDTLCELYLELSASYKFNNDDPDCDPALYYPDRIEFPPFRQGTDSLSYRKTIYAPGHQ